MSEPAPLPSPDPTSLVDLIERWPKDESGFLAQKLMLAYLTEVLIENASSAEANPVTAQRESGAGKALANIIKDVRRVSVPLPERKPLTAVKTLHRFQPPEAATEKTDPKT